MSNWTAICALEDIPVLGSRVLLREDGNNIAIFRTGKRVVENSGGLGYPDAHVLDQAAVCHGSTSSNANITHIP